MQSLAVEFRRAVYRRLRGFRANWLESPLPNLTTSQFPTSGATSLDGGRTQQATKTYQQKTKRQRQREGSGQTFEYATVRHRRSSLRLPLSR
jgi:hypothetical protein